MVVISVYPFKNNELSGTSEKLGPIVLEEGKFLGVCFISKLLKNVHYGKNELCLLSLFLYTNQSRKSSKYCVL